MPPGLSSCLGEHRQLVLVIAISSLTPGSYLVSGPFNSYHAKLRRCGMGHSAKSGAKLKSECERNLPEKVVLLPSAANPSTVDDGPHNPKDLLLGVSLRNLPLPLLSLS